MRLHSFYFEYFDEQKLQLNSKFLIFFFNISVIKLLKFISTKL